MTRADFPLEFATPEELSAYIQELQKFQAQMNHPMDRVCLRCGTVTIRAPTRIERRVKRCQYFDRSSNAIAVHSGTTEASAEELDEYLGHSMKTMQTVKKLIRVRNRKRDSIAIAERNLRLAAVEFASLGLVKDSVDSEGRRANQKLLRAARRYATLKGSIR